MAYSEQQVTSVRRWSEKSFSFTTTRPDTFDFRNGEFVTIGLRVEGRLIARAYSIVSTNDDDHLEFLSIHVPDGPLTSRLINIRAGDVVWVNNKPTGSLTLRSVQPGRHLYLLATGTGLAPFLSLIRSRELYALHDKVVLAHTVRTVRELAYAQEIRALCDDRLLYFPTVTREPYANTRRATELFRSGTLASLLKLPQAEAAQDRVMLCGNPHMLSEMTNWLRDRGWTVTNHSGTGTCAVEKAFVLDRER